MCKAFDDMEREAKAEGYKEGEKCGEERGVKAGEEKLALLVRKLMNDNRIKDVLSVTEDEEKRQALYKEYCLA